MIAALQPLTQLPGVRLVMFVTEDGVPIAVPGRDAQDEDGLQLAGDGNGHDLGREDAIAAVATGWMHEIRAAVGQASWHEPNRIVLRGLRGTLVMQRARGAVLLLLLSRGLAPEEVRLPMDATVARLNRSSGTSNATTTIAAQLQDTPGPIPSVSEPQPTGDSLDVGSNQDTSQ